MKKIKDRFHNMKLNAKFTLIITFLMLVAIFLFSVIVFNENRSASVKENGSNVEYLLERSYGELGKHIESINISTQFFLSDSKLLEYLKRVKKGENISTYELIDFYNTEVSLLERMINSNPYLYQIRIYADSETMQEMMPVLYRKSRMEQFAWSQDENLFGWKFNYKDEIFADDSANAAAILSNVSPIEDYQNGELGILEVAMTMKTMFPELYEPGDDYWNCFISEDGTCYQGEEGTEHDADYMAVIRDKLSEEEEQDSIRTYFETVGGKSLIIGLLPVKELSGTMACVNDITSEIAQIHRMQQGYIVLMLVLLIVLAAVINLVVKAVLRQFYSILLSIREVQKGNLDVEIQNCGQDEMGELGMQINKMLARIRQLMEDNIKREVLVKNSEIRALQNQINAHFIYNVLESIKMMAEVEEQYEISDAITSLGQLLRYSMKWNSPLVTVREEISYISNYLKLMNLRFDYEIYLSLNIPEPVYDQKIPKMSLQPLVENAIYHGIEQMAEDTNIYIKGILDGSDCVIEVTDAGRGMTEEEVQTLYRRMAGEVEVSGGNGNGIGLKNVQDRIRMSFGPEYGLKIYSRLGCYTKVQIRIPVQSAS